MSKKSLLLMTSLIALGACGHYAPPETFESKMARYQVKQSGAGAVPKIEPMAFEVKRSRAPASVTSNHNDDVGFSNKKLYFITLYRQYHELAPYTKTGPQELKQCPSFHSALVDHSVATKANITWNPQYDSTKLGDDNYAQYHPELYLSMADNEATPRVLDFARKNTQQTSNYVQKAIAHHVEKTHAELAELCEYGTSDNYYAFENLNTEIRKRSVAKADTSGMSILLKTTIFSNKAVIESLKKYSTPSRSPASIVGQTDYEYEVMKRLGVPWAQQYYQALKQAP